MDFVTKVFSLSPFLAKSRQAVKQVFNQFFSLLFKNVYCSLLIECWMLHLALLQTC